jgi:hypothetical protein
MTGIIRYTYYATIVVDCGVAKIHSHLNWLGLRKFPGFTLGPLDLKIENKKILIIIGPVVLVKTH